MNIGTNSISLPVQNIPMSLAFFETLGFDVLDGGRAKDYAVLHNGEMLVGLYHGIALLPVATLQTGWNPQAEPLNVIAHVPALSHLI